MLLDHKKAYKKFASDWKTRKLINCIERKVLHTIHITWDINKELFSKPLMKKYMSQIYMDKKCSLLQMLKNWRKIRRNKLQNYLTYHQHIHPFITQPCIIMHQTLINCDMMGHYNSAFKMQITFKVGVWCKILRFDFTFDIVLPQMFLPLMKDFFCKVISFFPLR